MIQQKDNPLWFKFNGLLRMMIVGGALNGFAPPVVVTEYPKSGGTWLSQMISAALGIPYPRNRLPMAGRQVIHGHYRRVHPRLPTVLVWRDGRDTMVSFYYHLMFEKPRTSHRYNQKLHETLDIEDRHDVHANLPRFIDWAFTGGYPRYSWADYYRCWEGRSDCAQTSYENCTPIRLVNCNALSVLSG